MYFVYQIADVPVYGYFRGGDEAVTLSVESNWRNPSQEFTGVSGRVYTGPATRSLLEETEVNISGFVYARNATKAKNIASAIRSWAGRVGVPIIVARHEDIIRAGDCPHVDWLVGYGTIVSDPVDYRYGAEDTGENGYVRLNLDMEMQLFSPLRRMENWLWEYRLYTERIADYYSDQASRAGTDNYFWHPRSFDKIEPGRYFINWEDQDTIIDPRYWGIKYSNPNDGGIGSDFGVPQNIIYYSDPHLWNVEPRVIYAFRDLQPYGSLRLVINRPTGNFHGQTVTQTSELDLVQLNTDMNAAGFGGLTNSDIVYTGSIEPFPGFVIRDGQRLSGIRPRWAYEDVVPGAISNGPGKIRVEVDLSSCEMAYLIDYGAL